MTRPDRLAELSQRITALTGHTLGRDQVMAVVGRAFEHEVDLDDDGQLRALVAGFASPAAVNTPAVPGPVLSRPAESANAASARPASPAPAPSTALGVSEPPPPSGATAKTMAGLALFGGSSNLLAAVVLVAAAGYLSEQDMMPGWYPATTYVIAACEFIVAGALLAGGVMTLRRKRSGPRIVVFGCVLSLIVFVGDLAATLAVAHDSGSPGVGTSPLHYLSGLIIPVAALVLALLPSTTRWLTDPSRLSPPTGRISTVNAISHDGLGSRARPRTVVRAIGGVLVAAAVVGAGIFAVTHYGRTQPGGTGPGATKTRTYARQIELPFGTIYNAAGVAVSSTGTVYASVAGRFDHGVIKLGPGETSPEKLPFPELGPSAAGAPFNPYGVAVDAAGDVYLAYGEANRVLKLAAGASAPTEMALGSLNNPHGVAVDADGNVYVTDTDNHRVLKLAAGAGAPVELPFRGLQHPYGIAVDRVGNVYVTDDRDDERGVSMLAANSDAPVALAFPGFFRRTGIAVDSAGSVYVVDASANSRVLKLEAGAGAPTELPFTGLDKPKNVAVDTAGNVYVINEGGRRILKLPTGN
ncbi:NHL repeat-containing protein [Mycolicibacterium mucogenicum]|uniref:NHL repeat-containing protein n=1 Tax=Mycolicibacterium mucogenicum TaxID=56689 RepID=UPI00226A6E82|nr:NHL repeat-containing protein [Mycolicibacterium mucogenicum]MCX8559155.1 NHL repeat-containing protein [Mycolicibacterium mucogenicum]